MNRTKATICTALLYLIIIIAAITLLLIGEKGVTLFHLTTAFITGTWLADRLEDFYNWLRKNKQEDKR